MGSTTTATALDLKEENGANSNGTNHQQPTSACVMKPPGRSTSALHSGTKSSQWAFSPVVPPIYQTTTFEVLQPGNAVYDYSRSDNPTRSELQKLLANIEAAKYGLAFSSGLGAMTTLTFLLQSGQNIMCTDDVYGGTYRLFTGCFAKMGLSTTYVDGTNLDNWTRQFQPGKTRLVWIETPTNPLMKVIDIEAVSSAIKRLDENCIIVVDNTFITPILQSPLKLGADIVMHSCSKYIGGHSDIIMGAIMTNNDELYSRLKFFQNSLGITPSVHDCALMIRSIKTLEIRVLQQSANATKLAHFLEAHKYVEKVIYPGLKSHPQYELAKRQCSGYGAMLSIYIKSITGDESSRLMRAVGLFHPAESLGCVCSLIEVPSLMTHASIPAPTRAKLGITDNLVRISVGIENIEDLIDDLDNAFKQVYESQEGTQ